MRVLAALFSVLAAAGLAVGGIVLSNLFAGYKDSPDSTYLQVAALPLSLGFLFLAGGVAALRAWRRG